jgi:hypothetical protein
VVELGRGFFSGASWSVAAERLPLGSFGVCVSFSVPHWLWFEFITIHQPRCRRVRWLNELAYCICVVYLLSRL